MPQTTLTHSQEKQRAARLSIIASGLLTVLKLIAGLLSGSLALLSEAAHGLIDFASTIMTWFAIKHSEKPADDNHHYGHGKIEAVAALIETGLLIALAIFVTYEALKRLAYNITTTLDATGIAIAVTVFAIAVDFVRWRHLKRIAALTKSDALSSNALHFSSDMLGSIAVLGGLLAVEFGYLKGDSIATLIVSVVIAIAGWRLGKQTINTLVDVAPSGAETKIRAALNDVRGIAEVQSIRVRSVGATLYTDVKVLVPRSFSLERVSDIKIKAQAAICDALPNTQSTITTEPFAYSDETILERVLLIAAKRRVPVHHVTVQELVGRLSISLDVEVDGRMSLSAAHQIASKLETAIRDEFGSETEVETHIEPLEAQGIHGEDAPRHIQDEISGIIRHIESQVNGIGDVHSIRVRETPRGLVVSLHVKADAAQSVETVHAAVDELERRVRKACPKVVRIVSHAEPR
jgi:cation diffusion facilitator family transporter